MKLLPGNDFIMICLKRVNFIFRLEGPNHRSIIFCHQQKIFISIKFPFTIPAPFPPSAHRTKPSTLFKY